MRILFTGRVPERTVKKLEDTGHQVLVVSSRAYVDEKDFIRGIQDIDIYVSGGLEICTKAVIESANSLKAIIFLGVDYKNYIDADAAKANNIQIFNMPGANAQAVAEFTFLLMLLAIRNAASAVDDITKNIWKAQKGTELKGKTLGILGAGNIAQEVSNIAQGFGMKVIYWTRSGSKQTMQGDFRPLDVLYKDSDIISLHIPKDAGEVIDKTALECFQKHAILVNTSPAILVNANDLYEVLKNEDIASAAFDCFYAEGEKAFSCSESKLLSLPKNRFILTPHTAWSSQETEENMFKRVTEYIACIS